MSEHYEPLTPEEREMATEDAHEKPTFREFKRIVLAADYLAMIVGCGSHSEEEVTGAITELNAALGDCIPAQAIMCLDTDDTMTSESEFKDIVEEK